MEYREIYNICQPVMDWLKSNYPHNHKIVIDNNSAVLIETNKATILDKEMMKTIEKSQNKDYMKEVYEKFLSALPKPETKNNEEP